MKSAAENLTPTRVKLTVEVPSEELQPFVDAAYTTIGAQIQVPGFRKGKVPARLIDQRVGRGGVMQEAVNEALPQFFGQAVEDNNVRPLGQPEVDITEVPLEEGQQLAFTVEVDVRPEVTLPDLEGIAVEVDPVEAGADDVEERLTELRARFGTLTTVERAVENGDFVSLDLAASIGGEEIDSVSGVSYEVGSGNMLEGMDEALLGMSAGDTKDFSAPLAGGDREGESADCTVTVQSVKERELPELDDEFAQLASEFDTIDELRADVEKQSLQAKKFEQGIQARDRLLDRLIELTEIPVPESIVEAEVNQHLEGEGRLEDDEHRAEVDESTRKALRAQFLLDAIVEEEEIQVEQQELIEYLVMQSQQYGMDPNQFAQALDSQGQVPAMVGEVGRRKALASVLDRAVVTDTSGTKIDINDLVPGGEDDADEAASEDAASDEAAADKKPAKKSDDEKSDDAKTDDKAEAKTDDKPAKKAAKKSAKKATKKADKDEAKDDEKA
ncbi:MAG: trigger factor [Micrococcales bacterium]|nr:trigger factor [Micrococcales bacterium]